MGSFSGHLAALGLSPHSQDGTQLSRGPDSCPHLPSGTGSWESSQARLGAQGLWALTRAAEEDQGNQGEGDGQLHGGAEAGGRPQSCLWSGGLAGEVPVRFLIGSWTGEGRAWAPLRGPHYLFGHQLRGKSKYSPFPTCILCPLKLSSPIGYLEGGNPESCGEAARFPSQGLETWWPGPPTFDLEPWAVQIDRQKHLSILSGPNTLEAQAQGPSSRDRTRTWHSWYPAGLLSQEAAGPQALRIIWARPSCGLTWGESLDRSMLGDKEHPEKPKPWVKLEDALRQLALESCPLRASPRALQALSLLTF